MIPNLRVRGGHWTAAVKEKKSSKVMALISGSQILTSARRCWSCPLPTSLTRPRAVPIQPIARQTRIFSLWTNVLLVRVWNFTKVRFQEDRACTYRKKNLKVNLDILVSCYLRTQVVGCADQVPSLWHFLLKFPERVKPRLQIWMATEPTLRLSENLMMPNSSFKAGHPTPRQKR